MSLLGWGVVSIDYRGWNRYVQCEIVFLFYGVAIVVVVVGVLR